MFENGVANRLKSSDLNLDLDLDLILIQLNVEYMRCPIFHLCCHGSEKCKGGKDAEKIFLKSQKALRPIIESGQVQRQWIDLDASPPNYTWHVTKIKKNDIKPKNKQKGNCNNNGSELISKHFFPRQLYLTLYPDLYLSHP